MNLQYLYHFYNCQTFLIRNIMTIIYSLTIVALLFFRSLEHNGIKDRRRKGRRGIFAAIVIRSFDRREIDKRAGWITLGSVGNQPNPRKKEVLSNLDYVPVYYWLLYEGSGVVSRKGESTVGHQLLNHQGEN